ncbi:MAG: hypothetical protein KH828_01785 [Clostridiales bacterium]|nr:hypothetical protein [Clostridiales bacterium]
MKDMVSFSLNLRNVYADYEAVSAHSIAEAKEKYEKNSIQLALLGFPPTIIATIFLIIQKLN